MIDDYIIHQMIKNLMKLLKLLKLFKSNSAFVFRWLKTTSIFDVYIAAQTP